MLLVNLNQRFSEPQRRSPIWMPAFGLAIAVLALVFPVTIQKSGNRDLTVEERETVYSVIERVEASTPKIGGSLDSAIAESEQSGWQVDQDSLNIPLVSQSKSGLVFSENYFEQDTVTQQRTL